MAAELATRLAALLGFPPGSALAHARPLRDLGLDSLLAIAWRNQLATALELDLPSTLTFDHPTIDALATHLTAALEPKLEALDERALADLLALELATP
jgi:hypothetical protein